MNELKIISKQLTAKKNQGEKAEGELRWNRYRMEISKLKLLG